jgi:hypothetical protein
MKSAISLTYALIWTAPFLVGSCLLTGPTPQAGATPTPAELTLEQLQPQRIASKPKTVVYRKPNIKPTSRRQGGGSRSDCGVGQTPPELLTPKDHVGQTLSGHPQLFAYVPQSAQVKFTLIQPDSPQSDYTTTVMVPQAGVVAFPLPSGLPPLQVGKSYEWFISMSCNPNQPSKRLTLRGIIRRVQPNADLLRDLEKADVGDRPALYAAAGIWFETLSTLADLRRANPRDARPAQAWRDVLQSVDLSNIAQAPLTEIAPVSSPSPAPQPPKTKGSRSHDISPPARTNPSRRQGGGSR